MPLKRSLTAALMIASLGAAVASCAKPVGAFPPATDLIVQPKPVPPDDVLTSRIAGEQYDNAVEAWGEEGWARVSRLCRFFDTMGMRGLDCPPPPRPG
ncbi:hypothetical protein [Brevundimonas sp. 'scallop']|uniref:hypothetical protein n=1 Tax=Brevundimonas sp. 'scallop' TaxID=2562582 RepID=UPI00197AC903|nr:hypothetical protein [Brevundimonas sp. 'scallop']